jgi:hypothetical protein
VRTTIAHFELVQADAQQNVAPPHLSLGPVVTEPSQQSASVSTANAAIRVRR